jgi:hypothetical protein
MPDGCGRNIDEDAFPPDLEIANEAPHKPAHAEEPAALAAVDERGFEMTDEDVLEIGEQPPGFE